VKPHATLRIEFHALEVLPAASASDSPHIHEMYPGGQGMKQARHD
jgi:hypothetical protein